MRTFFVCSQPCCPLCPFSVTRMRSGRAVRAQSNVFFGLPSIDRKHKVSGFSILLIRLSDKSAHWRIPHGLCFFRMTLGWCLTAHWRVLHAVNRVDVRMRILGSFSTAHWLNPPYTAVPGKNLHFGFQEVTVPWNPGFRGSGSRLSLCLSLKLFVLL